MHFLPISNVAFLDYLKLRDLIQGFFSFFLNSLIPSKSQTKKNTFNKNFILDHNDVYFKDYVNLNSPFLGSVGSKEAFCSSNILETRCVRIDIVSQENLYNYLEFFSKEICEVFVIDAILEFQFLGQKATSNPWWPLYFHITIPIHSWNLPVIKLSILFLIFKSLAIFHMSASKSCF
jgi:hypothetical protein